MNDSAAGVDLTAFGLQDGDERWLGLLRVAETPLGLGRIGTYEVLEEVRRGGQGVVYRARCTQTGGVVALKRLLAGALSSAAVRARFARETEALRSLKHPHIVTALSIDEGGDGATFAMEWVEGSPITSWAAERRNTRSGVLEIAGLMLKVCEAVQHAHQRGLMHRDLKPANILIVNEGVEESGGGGIEGANPAPSPSAAQALGGVEAEPKVLDFGLAKPTLEAGSSDADVTRGDQFVGTVGYASPEQLRGRPEEIDTRSDLYSLGVILYEMLTGRRPYATGDNVAAALQAIEHTPLPPPRALNSCVSRDLEAVTLVALAPQRTARYQSADALAADLRSVLAGAPVSARAYGRWEPLFKTLRRHRLAAAFSATIVALLAAFAVFATISAERLAQQRDVARAAQTAEADARRQAELEQRKAEAVRVFLEDLLAQADPARSGGRDVSVRAALDAASRSLERSTGGPEPLHAAMRLALGRTYQNLGAMEAAEAHFRAALEISRTAFGETHGETLTAQFSLALLLHSVGRAVEARELVATAIERLREDLRSGELPEGVEAETLATMLCILGYGDDAELLYARVIEADRALHGDVHARVAADLSTLAGVLSGRGRHERAEAKQREALAVYRQLYGEQHPDVARELHSLGTMLALGDKHAEAEPCYREALALYDALGMRRSAEGGHALFELAGVLMRLGRFDDAEPPAREAIETHAALLGPEHLDVAECEARLGRLLDRRGDHADAEPHLRDVLDGFRAALRPGHWRTAVIAKDLGACLTSLGCFEEAEALLLSALEEVRGAPHYRRDEVGKTLEELVRLYAAWPRPDELLTFQTLRDQESP